ncbi:MAG TPA: tetratricopeptide repeat protein, partial [Acetobacteraceae bacterium]|nr:tetratricopeptide repeat protein [Acetobacteraceae bacterium]
MTDSATAFAAALAHHEAGRLQQAETIYHNILASDPDHAESLHLLGLITAQQGAPAGVDMIRRAIDLAPGRAPHHNSLAAALRMFGRDAEAVAEYRTAAALRPGSAEIHNNLATVLNVLGCQEEAIEEYRRAAARAPGVAEIWYNLASALAESGQHEEVEDCFRRAIRLRPAFGNALANYGRWLITRARWLEAEVWLNEAVRLEPTDARNWNNLGIVRQEIGRLADAEACYRRAIACEPAMADAHYNLGCLLTGHGRTDDALECHRSAIAADPLHGAARLALCVAQLPILYTTTVEVEVRRSRYLAALNQLATAVTAPPVAHAVAAAIGTSQPFFLPYQGQNDREPQAKYGRLVCRLLAKADPPAPLANHPIAGERIRVGIVSGFFLDHTIFRLFLGSWLTEFDRDRFELTAFHTGRASDAVTERCAQSGSRFVRGLSSPTAWRASVSETLPHVLLYPEIGMDPVAPHLAAQRLAPVQCVAWGHPETSGLPTMDYFLSTDLMEPSDGASHYTEQLVRLPGLGLHYTAQEQPTVPLDRETLGLPQEVPIYWSGQALYKYLPQYDCIYPQIAAAVGVCRFIFIGFAKSDAVTTAFRERLCRAFAAFGLDAEQYCVILPPMPQQQFIAAVGLADVILDTPGWSGGRSTLDCLSQNPAIVTCPGPLMRGRHTAAILRQVGCEATIAGSLDEYVAIAARLGLDPAWRTQVRAKVAEGKHRV